MNINEKVVGLHFRQHIMLCRYFMFSVRLSRKLF